MKLLLIFCSEYLADPVREALAGLKVECSAEVPEALGCAGPFKRWNTPAFPGTANLFFVPLPDETVPELKDTLCKLLEHCGEEPCLRIVALPAEKVL
jgi:hypothetical protein